MAEESDLGLADDCIEWLAEHFMAWFLLLLMACIGLFVFVGIPLLIYGEFRENQHCKTWEERVVHQEAWTEFIWNGQMMAPIPHPAGDVTKKVCLEPK